MCEKFSFRVFEDMLNRLVNMYYLVGDNYILFMESWYFLKSFRSLLLKIQILGGCLLCCFLFCLFLFSPIISHQFELHDFSSSRVDPQNRIRVLLGGYIIFQSHLIFLNYCYIFSIHFLNMYHGPFIHSVINWILKEILLRR